MLVDLTAVLLQFRFVTIAILSDIEKAFLQLQIAEEDRTYVRFLWFSRDGSMVMYWFTRVAFGIVASPFLMNAVIRYHIDNNVNEFSEQVRRDFYADNMCTGAESAEKAVELYTKTKELFCRCSMNLRSWVTNDETV